MAVPKVVVVGAGVGGLSAALSLAAQGLNVTVLERQATPGGKLRELEVDGQRIDAGPTVFTMRWVFDELFEAAGLRFSEQVALAPAAILARHAWCDGALLDLHADPWRSAEAIAAFAGPREGKRFIDFTQRAARVYRTLEAPFLRRACAGPVALARALGPRRLDELWNIAPFESLAKALARHFEDARLRQLFGRYATYCGSSPYLAPATLMLVAHVEQEGVWFVQGGMQRLAVALAGAAESRGARLRYGAEVARLHATRRGVEAVELVGGERINADAVIANADAAALAQGLFGAAAARAVPQPNRAPRSLSAVTWGLHATAQGFGLHRHNVFFSPDYAAEFESLFVRGRVPAVPTVYVCAQDRDAYGAGVAPGARERLLVLINAPATGDHHHYDAAEIHSCQTRTFELLRRCGLGLESSTEATQVTTPNDFHRLFPATGGALYGPASHGWRASFARPGATTALPGLYLAGGSVHPGPGVPMAALSGRIAANALLADLASTRSFHPVAMPGGMSTR